MRLFYRKIQEKTKISSDPSFVVWDSKSSTSDPVFSSTKEEFLGYWVHYLTDIFAQAESQVFKTLRKVNPENARLNLLKSEVISSIQVLKNLKAAGIDEITNEDIKLTEKLKPDLIHAILSRIWVSETCPEEFRKSIIFLFPKPDKPGKKKDLRYQQNYRPIALLPTLRKLYEVILSARLLSYVTLTDSKFGFIAGRSTSDCIFLLIESILEARYISRGRCGGKTQKLFAGFLDFKSAFDKVPRFRIWDKLYWRFGVTGKILRVIRDLYTNTSAQAVVNGMITKEFPIKTGVLQGSVLGPTLFLLFIDDLLEKLHKSNLGIPMLDFVISVLAYADDITLLSLSVDNLQCLLNICESWRKSNEMTFGLDKCFILVFNSRSKKLEHLPSLYLQGPDGKPHRLVSNYPEKSKELYLGFNPTDLIARSKIDEENIQPHILVQTSGINPILII